MTLGKSRKQIIIMTVLLFIFGNISLVFEMSSVEKSYGRQKLIISHDVSLNVSIFQHYPLDIDLANVVSEAILKNSNIPYKPINPYSYKYIHTPVPCDFKQAEKSNSILIVVKSHVLNTNQRLAIRHVWKNARDNSVRLIFLLGKYNLEGEQWRVEKEVKLYHDIVQGNFIDSFDHITYKIMMGFDWINRHCIHADILLFIDDDFYVYPTAMLTFLRQLPNQQDTFIGKVLKKQYVKQNSAIRKSPKFKHYTFKEIPKYVKSGSFVMSRYTARKFHIAFPYVKYFEMDDIYLGIVAQKLDIDPQHDSRFDTNNPLALVFECSHNAPRLLNRKCPLAGWHGTLRPAKVTKVTKKPDTFWIRLRMLPQIMKFAAKQTMHTFI